MKYFETFLTLPITLIIGYALPFILIYLLGS